MLDDFREKTTDTLEKEAGAREHKSRQIEKDYDTVQLELRDLTIRHAALESLRDNQEKALSNAKADRDSSLAECQSHAITCGFSSIEDVRSCIAKSIDIAAVRAEVGAYRMKAESALKQLNDLKMKSSGLVYSSKKHENVKEQIAVLQERSAAAQRAIGAASQEMARLRKACENKKAMESELDGHNNRARDLAVLEKMFRSSGFVDFVSRVYLLNICKAANRRFEPLTRKKFRLELSDDNSFLIRDFLCNGQLRDVLSLSGGQVFQASLCLALALAENVRQHSREDRNFFFLDEGFGTQDRESIALVFDTLKSLRAENRVVGIISHVEDLKEEIGTWLQIENTVEKGSIVKASWE